MKKLLEDIKNDKIIHYILIIMASCIAIIPLLQINLYGTDDGFIHILRIIGVENIIKNGEFPPFIYSNFCRGFGYAINLFYGPLVTYGPLLFRIFNLHYYDCLKIYTLCTIIISGIAMYKLTYQITKKRPIALIGAIIYIFIPYRLETIYNRFAIGEFSAYMFIPLVFMGLYNLLNEDGKKHYYITIGAVGLMLTHTITTEYTALFCLLYVILNIPKLKDKEVLKKIGINIIFIIGISLFFIIPIAEHKFLGNYCITSSENMGTNGAEAHSYAIELKQLFIDEKEESSVSFKLGIPFICLMLLGIYTYKKMDKNYTKIYLSLLLIAVISLWMSTKYFPWMIMPNFLCTLQFPWRMLMFFEFAMSIICAINLYTLISKKENIEGALLILSVILIVLTMQKTNYKFEIDAGKSLTDEEYENKVLSQQTLSHMAINREYLPLNAMKQNYEYLNTRENKVYVLSGTVEINNEYKNGLKLKFNIANGEKETILELPYLYYLGYEATVNYNGEQYKLKTFESDNGFVAIQLNDLQDAEIFVEYKGTTLEKVAYAISAGMLVLFICYVINSYKKSKTNSK